LAFTNAPDDVVTDAKFLTDLSIGLTKGPYLNDLLPGGEWDCDCHVIFSLSRINIVKSG